MKRPQNLHLRKSPGRYIYICPVVKSMLSENQPGKLIMKQNMRKRHHLGLSFMRYPKNGWFFHEFLFKTITKGTKQHCIPNQMEGHIFNRSSCSASAATESGHSSAPCTSLGQAPVGTPGTSLLGLRCLSVSEGGFLWGSRYFDPILTIISIWAGGRP